MNIEIAQEFAKRNRMNPVWRAFKSKWDVKTPRKGSKAFDVFVADAKAAQASTQAVLDQIIAERSA